MLKSHLKLGLIQNRFLYIEAAIEYRFTIKRICDMVIITCSQMHRTDKYSQNKSIIWLVRLNGKVLI